MWAGIFLTQYRPKRGQDITKAMLLFGLETIQEEYGGEEKNAFVSF